jgi:drug/metabolite transporter (DMT)-like permease
MSHIVERLRALNGPQKIGLGFGLAGGLLAGIGWVVNPEFAARTLVSFLLAVGISSLTWGIVAWAIATAAHDVEHESDQE